MTSLDTIYNGLKRYARKDVLEVCLKLMRKLGVTDDTLTQRQAAQLIYLTCGVSEKERTKSALNMDRPSTIACRAVNEIESMLLSPDGVNESGVPTNVLRDLSRLYRGVKSQGYVDGKPIQVRGGAALNWRLHARHYTMD